MGVGSESYCTCAYICTYIHAHVIHAQCMYVHTRTCTHVHDVRKLVNSLCRDGHAHSVCTLESLDVGMAWPKINYM